METLGQGLSLCAAIGAPDGGAHCTAADLAFFLRAAHQGKLASSAQTRAFFIPQVKHHDRAAGKTVNYGFGLEFERRTDGAVEAYGKDGTNTGCSALLRYYPDLDLTLVLLCNRKTQRGVRPGSSSELFSPEGLPPETAWGRYLFCRSVA